MSTSTNNREFNMSKFLCVTFDRYVTEETTDRVIESESFEEVVREYMSEEDGSIDDDTIDWITDEYKQVNDTFGCLPGEETDHLFYKLS